MIERYPNVSMTLTAETMVGDKLVSYRQILLSPKDFWAPPGDALEYQYNRALEEVRRAAITEEIYQLDNDLAAE